MKKIQKNSYKVSESVDQSNSTKENPSTSEQGKIKLGEDISSSTQIPDASEHDTSENDLNDSLPTVDGGEEEPVEEPGTGSNKLTCSYKIGGI